MGEITYSDDTGTVEVVLAGPQVQSVRISNLWKDRFSTEALAGVVSGLIRGALPPRSAPKPPERHGDKHLPLSAAQSFMAELRAGRAATRRYIGRLKAGEVRKSPQTWVTDPENRVEVSYVGGRFNALLINPKWAPETTVQTLCDTILATLERVPLVQEPEPDPDLEEARRHYDAARRHLADK